MCEPVSVILAGTAMASTYAAMAVGTVSALSAVASTIGQNQQRQDQKGYQNQLRLNNEQQMEDNRKVATAAYLEQASQANVGLAQEREAAAASGQEETGKRLQAQGEANAAGAEGGAGGLALSGLLDDFHRQESVFRAHNDQNLLYKQQATAAGNESSRNQAEGRIDSIRPYQQAPVKAVDYIGAGLGVVQTSIQTGLTAAAIKK